LSLAMSLLMAGNGFMTCSCLRNLTCI
jgi:hypothetical protein